MTVVSDLIVQALRESNLIALGATPTTPQAAEALVRLNAIVSSVYGNEVGDPLLEWPIGNDEVIAYTGWTADQWQYVLTNTRLIALSDEAQTLYLPLDPPPGARVSLIDPGNRLAAAPITLEGNGRTIEGADSLTLSTNATNKTWFYRDDTGNWTLLSTLAADSTFPFPPEFDDFFITRLAMRLNPRYGRSLPDASVVAMEMSLAQLRARYEQPTNVPVDLAVLALTSSGRRRVRQGYGDNPGLGTRIVKGRIGWMN